MVSIFTQQFICYCIMRKKAIEDAIVETPGVHKALFLNQVFLDVNAIRL